MNEITEAEVIKCYRDVSSLTLASKILDISYPAIRKILITAGEYSSPRSDEINRRYSNGESIEQIAADMGISPKSASAYLPYVKGSYSAGPKTKNALHIARCRERKQTAANASAESQK